MVISCRLIAEEKMWRKGVPEIMCELNHCDLVMDTSRRMYCNDPDNFCYVCGNFTLQAQRHNINNFAKELYHTNSKVTLGDQDKTWASHKVCKTCFETW
ncbi:Hypothetical predicted protein [Octopus vulgaris]|uniref:Uncharacterized protein n=1 Tax=Octopus vulgaris TaxID=6645 RepID=A0AA36ASI2_OCTVU|nr:Hypothetical predicted protein [Octopus vulgaris]